MARLFLGNFDFEHQLAEPKRSAPARRQRLNAELTTAWLAVARDGDWIWTPEPIDERFLNEASQQGLPRVFVTHQLSEVPKNLECVPWGWSTAIRTLAQRHGWTVQAPSDAAVRAANSRATSEELERSWNVGLDGAQRIKSFDQLKVAIRSLKTSDAPWVVKAEFGMSARERILGRGAPKLTDEQWVQKRLALSGVVFFEPWVDRMGEVGIQLEIPEMGVPTVIGFTPMLVDVRGQYSGSWFGYSDSRFAEHVYLWEQAAMIAIQAALHLQLMGYFGPVGIDAMVYRDDSGSCRIRPLQDINARWTMGRLSLGWGKYLSPGEEGVWRHFTGAESPDVLELRPDRIIRTSPIQVGGTPCIHQSRIVIGATHEVASN